MSDLLNETPLAREWVSDALGRNDSDAFAKLVSAVIWTNDQPGLETSLLKIDPDWLVESINRDPVLLVAKRDPGKPQGSVLECARFESPNGRIFLVAILGFYSSAEVLEFRMLGISVQSTAPPSRSLSALVSGSRIQMSVHPQKVEKTWLERVMAQSPIPVMLTEFTHVTNEPGLELICLRIPYTAALWNPFDAVSLEDDAGLYPAINTWLRNAIEAIAGKREYLINLQSHHDGCEVSFLFRGGDVKRICKAWDVQPEAAARAAQLIENLHARVMPARKLVFEFDKVLACWFPSYAVLFDIRIVSDDATLMNRNPTPDETIIDSVQWALSTSNNAHNAPASVEWEFGSPSPQGRRKTGVNESCVKERTKKADGVLPCWFRASDTNRDE